MRMRCSLRARCAGITLPLLLLVIVGCTREKTEHSLRISVNQFVFHPNLEAVLVGFKSVVEPWASAHHLDLDMEIQVANADVSTAVQIAQQQVARRPALILALATPSAQAAVRASVDTPIVFAAITDPVGAGLVKDLDKPGGIATGTSDVGPYAQQFDLIKRIVPSARTVGVIRNPGEANSVASMRLIDKAIVEHGYEKVEVAVASTTDVLMAARSLVGRCDFLYMPADNTVLSALDAVIGVARSNKLPLFVGDEGSVKLGGVATLGIDYTDLGKETGRVAIRILEGGKPGEIPVAFGRSNIVFVNSKAASEQGVQLPPDVLAGARDLAR